VIQNVFGGRGPVLAAALFLLLPGCATTSDPNKADIFSYSDKKTQKYLDQKQATVDEMERQRAQLEHDRLALSKSGEQKRLELAVMQGKLTEMDRNMAVLEKKVRNAKVQTDQAKARRYALQQKIEDVRREMDSCKQQMGDSSATVALEMRLEELKRRQANLANELDAITRM